MRTSLLLMFCFLPWIHYLVIIYQPPSLYKTDHINQICCLSLWSKGGNPSSLTSGHCPHDRLLDRCSFIWKWQFKPQCTMTCSSKSFFILLLLREFLITWAIAVSLWSFDKTCLKMPDVWVTQPRLLSFLFFVCLITKSLKSFWLVYDGHFWMECLCYLVQVLKFWIYLKRIIIICVLVEFI